MKQSKKLINYIKKKKYISDLFNQEVKILYFEGTKIRGITGNMIDYDDPFIKLSHDAEFTLININKIFRFSKV